MSELGDADSGSKARQWLAEMSDELADRSADIATESDRWFLLALKGVERGAQQTHDGLGALVKAAISGGSRLVPRLSKRPPRERIQEMLKSEARRLEFDVSREDFVEFSEKMATLLELVFSGAVDLSDVAFDPAEAESPAQESLGEVGQKVPDQDEHDQENQADPLNGQK